MDPCSSVTPVDRVTKGGWATLSSPSQDPVRCLLALYTELIHLFAFYYLTDHRKAPAIQPRVALINL